MMHRYPKLLAAVPLLASPLVAHAAPVPERHVVLMDLGEAPFEGPPSYIEASASEAMIAEFAAMDREYLSVPHAALGSWTPIPAEIGRSLVGTCSDHSYAPSTLLKPEAEAHRRLFYPLVEAAACAEGLPVPLIDALLIQESAYNPLAVSPKGAFGLGQLMPATARQLGVDRFDVHANLRGAARYLRQLITRFGTVHLALAAYNAGPERIRIAKGLPAIPETLTYVRRVLRNWSVLQQAANNTTVAPD